MNPKKEKKYVRKGLPGGGWEVERTFDKMKIIIYIPSTAT